MKKTLLALALAGLSTASMAEVILYGQIKGGVEVTKVRHKKGTETQIVDYGSRIGFKGQEQLNGDLKAIWQLEQRVDIGGGKKSKVVGVDASGNPIIVTEGRGFGTRDSFIGLEGGFGKVRVGHLSTPVKEVNDKLDIWEYADNRAGLGEFVRDNDAVGRRTAISYQTPDFSGFKANVYVSPSDNNKLNDGYSDHAVYGLGAGYNANNIFADVAGVYVKNGANNDDVKANGKLRHGYQAVVQGGYDNGKLMAGVAYQRSQNVDEDSAKRNEVAASVAYTFDDALTLKGSAAYGFGVKDVAGTKAWENGKYFQGIVGADYALSKRTVVNGQVGYLQKGKKDYARQNLTSGGTLSVGMKHKF